jgi:hypothetical protein
METSIVRSKPENSNEKKWKTIKKNFAKYNRSKYTKEPQIIKK